MHCPTVPPVLPAAGGAVIEYGPGLSHKLLPAPVGRVGGYEISSSRSAMMIRAEASISARWEKACGKLPR
jgi:hypothetical protein